MTLLEMTLNAPGFKAYCRRRIVPNSTPTMAEIYAAARQVEKANFKAFCKRKGINSVLAREDKRMNMGEYSVGNGQTAQLKKVNGEFISIYTPPEPSLDEKIAALLEEQNRLLAILKAA